ncbi:MAG: LysE family translocator [Hyphomicrobiaceae bacterium]|nr:MAG: LysE family translocator [Hyphomicrobiaceae bacterium]
MSIEIMLALATFAFVGSITPGPNNVMVLASGLNFGFRRTVPHLLGVGIGFPAMIAAVGFGLGSMLASTPALQEGLKYAGAAYLLYLAWRIATAEAADTGSTSARPLSFLEAAAFQWLNPKGWVLAVGAILTYSRPGRALADVPLIALIFLLATLPSVVVWAGFGAALERLLQDKRKVRILNVLMGLTLAASVMPMLFV